ncbi:MAG TPA: ABC transporter ATP-binding protein [Chloroflexota bacterium]
MAKILTVEGVSAGYGDVQVLWEVDLQIEHGELVALIGSNGAGKTTLLRVLSGLMPPMRGRVTFDGHDITHWPSEAIVSLGIVHIPQGRRLFQGLTVRQNLMMGAYTRHDGAEVRRNLSRVFDLFPILRERANQAAGSMSGGEQQMCAIGRGLMANPQLLLIDEMSLGLAPVAVDNILKVIDQIHSEGTTTLIVEQDVQVALEHADRGYVLENGRIALTGLSAELLRSAEIQRAYLGI